MIETLVAITILMMAIAGPISISGKALTAALDARNVAIASNLAQEGIEELSNLKDNGAWPPGGGGCTFVSEPTAATACGVSISPGSISAVSPIVDTCANLNGCHLTLNDANLGYTYSTNNDANPTPFTRYFYLVQKNTQYLATVVVVWTTGTVVNQVQLQELFSNATR